MSAVRNTISISNLLGINDESSFKNLQRAIKDEASMILMNSPGFVQLILTLKEKQNSEHEGSKPIRKRGCFLQPTINSRIDSDDVLVRSVCNSIADSTVKTTLYENQSRNFRYDLISDKPTIGRKTRTNKKVKII